MMRPKIRVSSFRRRKRQNVPTEITKKKTKVEEKNLEYLDELENFDIFMIDAVESEQHRSKKRRRTPKIARSFSEVRRSLGKIDENRNAEIIVEEYHEKESVRVMSRSRRVKQRNERKMVMSSKVRAIQERIDEDKKQRMKMNPLNIGPLDLSKEEYTALLMS